MRRRLASAICLAAILVASGVSAFTLDYCCGVDMHCAPCASMLCWVGQTSAGAHLSTPSLDSSSPAVVTAPVSFAADGYHRQRIAPSNGIAFDGSPRGFRLSLRV